ncbi:MAG: RNA 2',3'-cyclic phosphodiesterase [Planctomycetota bacterium]|jgi:2'-5' RNA ligase
MRTFVAIEVPDEVRKALGRVQDDLGRTGAKVRWVVPQNMHLTLKFLGEIDETQAELLQGELKNVAGHHASFTLEYSGIGTFPRKGAPRVVWAGCRGELDRIKALAAEVEGVAEAVGIPKETRPYSPHLTIGRAKVPPKAKPLIPKLADYERRSFGEQSVESFVLFQSTLTPQGAIYDAIETFELVRE